MDRVNPKVPIEWRFLEKFGVDPVHPVHTILNFIVQHHQAVS